MRIIRALKVGLIVVTLLYVGSSAPKSIWVTVAIIGAWALVLSGHLLFKFADKSYHRGIKDAVQELNGAAFLVKVDQPKKSLQAQQSTDYDAVRYE